MGDDGEIDEIGASSDEGEAVREIKSLINTAKGPVQPSKMNKLHSQNTARGVKESDEPEAADNTLNTKETAINTVSIKFRAVTTLMTCLCGLATITAKYNQFRGFIQEL